MLCPSVTFRVLELIVTLPGDEETTQIDHLAFIGQTREKSDMNEFKRVSGTKGEAHS